MDGRQWDRARVRGYRGRLAVVAVVVGAVVGVCALALSGAGPSIIAFTQGHADKIARAMQRTADRIGIEGLTKIVAPSLRGAQVGAKHS